MKQAVLRPARRSRWRCIIGRRTSACVPVRKIRPLSKVYLSSRETAASGILALIHQAFWERASGSRRGTSPQGCHCLGSAVRLHATSAWGAEGCKVMKEKVEQSDLSVEQRLAKLLVEIG